MQLEAEMKNSYLLFKNSNQKIYWNLQLQYKAFWNGVDCDKTAIENKFVDRKQKVSVDGCN